MTERSLFLELKLIEENRKAILELAKEFRIRITQRFTPIPELSKEQLNQIEVFEKK